VRYTITVDGDVFEIEVGAEGLAWVNQEAYDVDLERVGRDGGYSLLVDNRSYDIHVDDGDNGQRMMVEGRPYRARLRRGGGEGCRAGERGNGRRGEGAEVRRCRGAEVRAPLPGLLVELRVREGERVEEQQVVAVVESMKMNLEIRAPRGGVVRDLRGAPGRQVAQDEVLVVLGSNGGGRE
jgi:pyruvate carboxylase subunit B